MSKVQEVTTLLYYNPTITAREVMKKMKVTRPYAYNLMSDARKRLAVVAAAKAEKPKVRMESSTTSLSPDRSLNIVQEHFIAIKDPVNHPEHYKVGGIETIDFIEGKNLGYNLGNAVKYISRADHKGNRLQDLQKAQWYLNREIAKSQA